VIRIWRSSSLSPVQARSLADEDRYGSWPPAWSRLLVGAPNGRAAWGRRQCVEGGVKAGERVRNQHLADISSGKLIEILNDDEGRKHFAFSAAGCLFLVTTTFASAQRAVSCADLPDSLAVMTAADSQRQTQLQQEIPQKNGDTKPSNAGTPEGQPVPASKRQPTPSSAAHHSKRIRWLLKTILRIAAPGPECRTRSPGHVTFAFSVPLRRGLS
jgi:hypothetical protein